MKKSLWISLFLLSLCVLTLSACSQSGTPQTPPQTDNTKAEEAEQKKEPHVHAFGEWVTVTEVSCTNEGVRERSCSCGATEKQVDAAWGHTVVSDPGYNATCSEEGRNGGQHCSVCNSVLIEQTVIPKMLHTEAITPAVAATCTTDGLTEGKYCSVCGEVLTEQTVISKTGHTETVSAGVAATCTADGKTEGKHCSVCGEVLTEQSVIPKTGHTEAISAAVEATCSMYGHTEGKYCSVCNETLVAPKSIAMLAHDFKNDACIMCGYAPEVLVTKVWMDNPGQSVRTGGSITFNIEAIFKYKPKSIVLWFKSAEKTSSTKSAVSSNLTKSANNTYRVTLNITDNMFPGKWVPNWYFVNDQYGTFIQEDFTEQDRQDIWFTVN